MHTNQPIQAPPAVGNFYGSSLPSEQIPPTQQFTPIFAPEPPKYQEAPHFQAPYQQTSFIAEEPKVSPKTSKFSLSSLIPTQILDKIPVNSFLAKEEFVQTKSEVSQAYNPRSSYEDVSFVTSPSETQAPIQTLVVEPTVINPQFFNKSPFYATPTTPVAQQLHQEAPPIVPEIPSQFAGPPPTFFNPENLQTKPVGLPEGSNRNPYSSGIGSR